MSRSLSNQSSLISGNQSPDTPEKDIPKKLGAVCSSAILTLSKLQCTWSDVRVQSCVAHLLIWNVLDKFDQIFVMLCPPNMIFQARNSGQWDFSCCSRANRVNLDCDLEHRILPIRRPSFYKSLEWHRRTLRKNNPGVVLSRKARWPLVRTSSDTAAGWLPNPGKVSFIHFRNKIKHSPNIFPVYPARKTFDWRWKILEQLSLRVGITIVRGGTWYFCPLWTTARDDSTEMAMEKALWTKTKTRFGDYHVLSLSEFVSNKFKR